MGWIAAIALHATFSGYATGLPGEQGPLPSRGGGPDRLDICGWGTEARMRRLLQEALPLGNEALAACLADAHLDPSQVDLFVVVSCAGYVTPGLDVLLACDVGMPSHVQRLHVGHVGCHAALPGLATADAVRARNLTAVCCAWNSAASTPGPGDPA